MLRVLQCASAYFWMDARGLVLFAGSSQRHSHLWIILVHHSVSIASWES
jgi:hypothetical protein